MLMAMAVSIATVTGMLAARSILDREMARNFRATRPASAVIVLDALNDSLLESMAARTAVVAVQAEALVQAKIQTATGAWQPMLVRIVADMDAMSMDIFERESGAWPPAPGALLIERSGIPMLGLTEGATALVETPRGSQQEMPIAGVVHDAGQPPSDQEQTIWAYATPETLSMLVGEETLDRLKLVLHPQFATSIATIERNVRPLAQALRSQGARVERIDIAPPNQHPHQWQFDSIVLLLLSFGILALVLQAVLLATILAGLLAPQVREIAVMKTLGARTAQIAGLYLSLVGGMAGGAALVGVPLGLYGAHWLAAYVAGILNLEIASYAVPALIVAACIGLALLLPLCFAWIAIRGATRRTVRAALDDHGITGRSVAARGADRWLAGIPALDPALRLAVRATVRRGPQLLLNVALLAAAGAIFMVAVNQLAMWSDMSNQAAAARRDDLLVFLRASHPKQAVFAAVRRVAGVSSVEQVDSQLALVDAGDQLTVTATPENSLMMNFVAPQTTLLVPRLAEGRWLTPQDVDAVVLNGQTRRAFPGVAPGDEVALLINHHPTRLRVVGIIEETLTRSAGYTTANVLDRVDGTSGRVAKLAVATAAGQDSERVATEISRQLTAQGFAVRGTLTRALIQRSQAAHVYILLALAAVIVLAIAVVGTLGLATALTAQVIQRTREFGILRALGASARHITRSILAEALLAGIISWAVALVLSLPLTALSVLAVRTAIRQPLAVQWSIAAAAAWLVLGVAFAAAASIYPARRAAALTVRQALSVS
jgi:putative ABC transport system permease protein